MAVRYGDAPMTLRLTIDEPAWRRHVDGVRTKVGADLVPVVKGNGYGVGRARLVAEASAWAGTIAVGTVHEALEISHAGSADVLCLTPALEVPDVLGARVVPTVGRAEHVAALRAAGRRGRVAVKLTSSMHRYGAGPDELPDLLRDLRAAGCEPHMFVFHPPLTTGGRTDDDVLAELSGWMPHLDPAVELSVSHLSIDGWERLAGAHPERRVTLRLGTALWHGDKSALHLDADVVDARAVRAGDRAGYRLAEVPAAGTLAMVGAGSAHGVAPLPDGRSPFHFARHRLALLEPPHMHTSMVLAPADDGPQPTVGDRVDVQRPLIGVAPDEVVWRR